MIYEKAILPALAAYGRYRGDDEHAHELALAIIQIAQKIPGATKLLHFLTTQMSAAKPRKVFGLTFPAPIGLAAGLDKGGVGLPFWEAVGFGFAEIGTVTPYRQPGNPRPRLFRLDEEQELINRMGFNSGGILGVEGNVRKGKRRVKMPVGISLGAMKATLADEPEKAKYDYATVGTHFVGISDFNVVNVSSPNTPGLRDLQGKAYIEDLLRYVITAIRAEAARQGAKDPPLLAKIAPDLSIDALDIIIEAALASGVAGLVIGNTTVTRPESSSQPLYKEPGGRSGPLLFEGTLELCSHVRRYAPALAIIFAGGIDSAEKAIKALHVADLIEVLTAFVFHGPRLIREIRGVRVPEQSVLHARRFAA